MISPPFLLQSDARVEELTDPENGERKTELIQRIFSPHEADIICGIALSSHLPDDKQIWASTANGRFSVRSVYKLATDLTSGSGVASASEIVTSGSFGSTLESQCSSQSATFCLACL